MATPAAMSNVRGRYFCSVSLLVCWFCLSQKKPYLAWNRDLLFFDCWWNQKCCVWVEEHMIWLQYSFREWFCMDLYPRKPTSFCAILCMFYHQLIFLSAMFHALVQSGGKYQHILETKEGGEKPLQILQSSCLFGPSVFYITNATEHKISIVYAWLCSCNVPAKQAGASLHCWNWNINVIGLLQSNLICGANSLTSSH